MWTGQLEESRHHVEKLAQAVEFSQQVIACAEAWGNILR